MGDFNLESGNGRSGTKNGDKWQCRQVALHATRTKSNDDHADHADHDEDDNDDDDDDDDDDDADDDDDDDDDGARNLR